MQVDNKKSKLFKDGLIKKIKKSNKNNNKNKKKQKLLLEYIKLKYLINQNFFIF